MRKQQSFQSNKYVMITGQSVNSVKATQNSGHRKNGKKINRISSHSSHRQKYAPVANNIKIEHSNKTPNANKSQLHHYDLSSLKKKATSPAIGISKKLKTQSQATDATPDRRLNTDYSRLGFSYEARFVDDHHNTSIAQLWHINEDNIKNFDLVNNDSISLYNQQKRQQAQKRQQILKQIIQKKSSIKKSESKISEQGQINNIQFSETNQALQDQQQEDQREISSISEINDKNKKNKKSIVSQKESDSNFSGYSYDGNDYALNQENKSSQVQQLKKGKIRSYSHQDKLKILNQAKYVPKTQSQLRMQKRYISSQLQTINQARQAQELDRMIKKYQKNKKHVAQQSIRKSQSLKMLQFLKSKSKQTQSLPKLSKPSLNPQKDQSPQTSMSLQNYINKAQMKKRMPTQIAEKCICNRQRQKQIDNLKRVEEVLKSKGINYNQQSLSQGMLILKTLPDYQPSSKIQIPRRLISNPLYKKFPL